MAGKWRQSCWRDPVNTCIPSLFSHAFSPLGTIQPRYSASRCLSAITSHRNPCRSLYWRSESKARVRRGLPTGHRLRPVWKGTCHHLAMDSLGAIGSSRRTGPVREGHAGLGRRPLAALRSATLHLARPAACLRKTALERVQGSLPKQSAGFVITSSNGA
jgi:hypothetical protein